LLIPLCVLMLILGVFHHVLELLLRFYHSVYEVLMSFYTLIVCGLFLFVLVHLRIIIFRTLLIVGLPLLKFLHLLLVVIPYVLTSIFPYRSWLMWLVGFTRRFRWFNLLHFTIGLINGALYVFMSIPHLFSHGSI